MLPAALIAALAPAALDMGRSLFSGIGRAISSKWFPDAARPQNVAEQVQLQDADTRRLEALAKLDTVAGQPSQWVVDLRASTRYIAVAAIVLSALTIALISPVYTVPPETWDTVGDWAQSAFFFLFGEHAYIRTRGALSQRQGAGK